MNPLSPGKDGEVTPHLALLDHSWAVVNLVNIGTSVLRIS